MSYSGLREAVSDLRLQNCSVRLIHSGGYSCLLGMHKDQYEAYWFNEKVSKEIRFLLSQFEVVLRNKINEAYVGHYGGNWLLSGIIPFEKEEIKAIENAKERIRLLGKTITHERLLAKLSMSFWVRLFHTPYRTVTEKLKDDIFQRNKSRFGHSVILMNDLCKTLRDLRDLRNKVSHQEFILDSRYDVKNKHRACINLIKRMSKDYYSLFKNNDNFDEEFADFMNFINQVLAQPHMNGYRW